MPLVVVKRRKAAGRSRRAADDMDHDVDAAELFLYRLRDGNAALRRGDIARDEQRLQLEAPLPADLQLFIGQLK